MIDKSCMLGFRNKDEYSSESKRIESVARIYEKGRKVFVNPDLTPMQQKEQNELRDELNIRKQNGEKVKFCMENFFELSTQNFPQGF